MRRWAIWDRDTLLWVVSSEAKAKEIVERWRQLNIELRYSELLSVTQGDTTTNTGRWLWR